jgi:hypothetical protein
MPIVHVISTPLSESVTIPPPPEVPKVGARTMFAERLRDKYSNVQVGQHFGTCTLVREPGWWLCHAGWTLNSVGSGSGLTGTLVAGGLFDFDAGEPPFMAAIFGGTGDFDRVQGELSGAPIENTDKWEYVLELIL